MNGGLEDGTAAVAWWCERVSGRLRDVRRSTERCEGI